MRKLILKALNVRRDFKRGALSGVYYPAIDTPTRARLENFVFSINGVPAVRYVYLQPEAVGRAYAQLGAEKCGNEKLLAKIKGCLL